MTHKRDASSSSSSTDVFRVAVVSAENARLEKARDRTAGLETAGLENARTD